MRKKSFWLSSNSRIPVPPERSRGPPGRSPCTRRPVSSEAPGRGGVPAQRGRTRKSAEHQPRRGSPFPPVSSSSSSFCLLRFPAVVPFASPAPGFGSRSRFSEPPVRLFDRVQVSENRIRLPESGSGAACAASIVPSGVFSVRLRPASPGFRRVQFKFGWPAFRRPGFPAYHPVPASCSARLLFVSFMVRISFRFVRSFLFNSALCRPVPFVLSVSVRSSVRCFRLVSCSIF